MGVGFRLCDNNDNNNQDKCWSVVADELICVHECVPSAGGVAPVPLDLRFRPSAVPGCLRLFSTRGFVSGRAGLLLRPAETAPGWSDQIARPTTPTTSSPR